jgi:hypothetical protein
MFREDEGQSKNICTIVLDFLIMEHNVKRMGASGASWHRKAGGALPSYDGISFN